VAGPQLGEGRAGLDQVVDEAGHELGWPAWGWALLAGSAALLAAFAVIERSIARRGGSPQIPAAVVRAPTMAVAALAIFVAMGTFGGFLFSMALHLQTGLGDSPLRAGLTFVPAALGFATGSLTWQRLPVRWHRRQIPVGFAVGVRGVRRRRPAAALRRPWRLRRDGAAGGLRRQRPGVRLRLQPHPQHGAAARGARARPDASGLLVTTVQLGQVVGVATFGTLFLSLVDPAAAAGPTAHAIAVTSAALAAACAVAALLGLRMLATTAR
jgi:hypothetical protein